MQGKMELNLRLRFFDKLLICYVTAQPGKIKASQPSLHLNLPPRLSFTTLQGVIRDG